MVRNPYNIMLHNDASPQRHIIRLKNWKARCIEGLSKTVFENFFWSLNNFQIFISESMHWWIIYIDRSRISLLRFVRLLTAFIASTPLNIGKWPLCQTVLLNLSIVYLIVNHELSMCYINWASLL